MRRRWAERKGWGDLCYQCHHPDSDLWMGYCFCICDTVQVNVRGHKGLRRGSGCHTGERGGGSGTLAKAL